MINRVLTTIFGSQHERDVKKLLPLVQAINDLEPEIKALSDAELRGKTEEFKRRLIHNKEDVMNRRLADGRMIAVRHRPMVNGGWVRSCSNDEVHVSLCVLRAFLAVDSHLRQLSH